MRLLDDLLDYLESDTLPARTLLVLLVVLAVWFIHQSALALDWLLGGPPRRRR